MSGISDGFYQPYLLTNFPEADSRENDGRHPFIAARSGIHADPPYTISDMGHNDPQDIKLVGKKYISSYLPDSTSPNRGAIVLLVGDKSTARETLYNVVLRVPETKRARSSPVIVESSLNPAHYPAAGIGSWAIQAVLVESDGATSRRFVLIREHTVATSYTGVMVTLRHGQRLSGGQPVKNALHGDTTTHVFLTDGVYVASQGDTQVVLVVRGGLLHTFSSSDVHLLRSPSLSI